METKIYLIKDCSSVGVQQKLKKASLIAMKEAPLLQPKIHISVNGLFGQIEKVVYNAEDYTQSVYLGYTENLI